MLFPKPLAILPTLLGSYTWDCQGVPLKRQFLEPTLWPCALARKTHSNSAKAVKGMKEASVFVAAPAASLPECETSTPLELCQMSEC